MFYLGWEQGKGTYSHIEIFFKFCCEKCTFPIQKPLRRKWNSWLSHLKSVKGYDLANSAISVLSSIIKPVFNGSIWKVDLWYADLLKGFFNIRPDLPRYATTWDVTRVFTFIKSKPIFEDCNLTTVSHRLAMPLYLTTGQINQSIKSLD